MPTAIPSLDSIDRGSRSNGFAISFYEKSGFSTQSQATYEYMQRSVKSVKWDMNVASLPPRLIKGKSSGRYIPARSRGRPEGNSIFWIEWDSFAPTITTTQVAYTNPAQGHSSHSVFQQEAGGGFTSNSSAEETVCFLYV